MRQKSEADSRGISGLPEARALQRAAAMRTLTSVTLMVLGLLLMFGLGGCFDDSMTVQELEELLAEAAVCEAGDRCVIVDTYCCPRAINERSEREVERALAEADTSEALCAADCVGFSDDDTATCVPVEDDHRCRIDPPQ